MNFEAAVRATGLTRSVGRLMAHLLTKFDEFLSDEGGEGGPEVRVGRSASEPVQLHFADRGILNITREWATFACWFPGDDGPEDEWISRRMPWVVGLLNEVLRHQNTTAAELSFELTWLLRDDADTRRLVEHLGLTTTLGGLFGRAEDFEIRSVTGLALGGLFDVDCELTAGRLPEYRLPGNVGLRLKYWSPGLDWVTGYERNVMDRFFLEAPDSMLRQLQTLFPEGEPG